MKVLIWWRLVALANIVSCDEWKLLWEDNFDFLDLTKWKQDISAWGRGNWEFQVFTSDSANSFVKDGKLFIKPTYLPKNINPKSGKPYGEDFLFNGVLDLKELYEACTQADNHGCKRTGNDIPPIMSASLQTTHKYSFRYGRVEIRAKMAVGDWLISGIHLQPDEFYYGAWPRSGQINMADVIGNSNLKYEYSNSHIGVQKMSSSLHWGVDSTQNRFHSTRTEHADYSRDFGNYFHNYILEWGPNGISWSVDGLVTQQVPNPLLDGQDKDWNFYQMGAPWTGDDTDPWKQETNMAPFDRKFHLVLNVAAGGLGGMFPDHGTVNRENNFKYDKPWGNTQTFRDARFSFLQSRDRWNWTWVGDNAAMQLDYIRVYQKSSATLHLGDTRLLFLIALVLEVFAIPQA